MNVATTTEQPVYLSSRVFEQDIPPTIADGIAGLLEGDRQIIIVTGKLDGRMSGFLADLTHCISRRGSLLRIKSPLDVEEMHAALAAQLHLPRMDESAVQLASRIGHRLQQPAPRGRFVLLCEAADKYTLPTLEALRQISNYPVSIVLVGGHGLTRQLRRSSLRSLRQRVTHQLTLNRVLFPRWVWLALAGLVAGVGLFWLLQKISPGSVEVDDVALPRPISATRMPEQDVLPITTPVPVMEVPAAEAVPVPEPGATQAAPAETPPAGHSGLRLTLEHELGHRPVRP